MANDKRERRELEGAGLTEMEAVARTKTTLHPVNVNGNANNASGSQTMVVAREPQWWRWKVEHE